MIKAFWFWLVESCKPIAVMITALIVLVNLAQASNYTPLLGVIVLSVFFIITIDLLIKQWVVSSD